MSADELKQAAATAAVDYIRPLLNPNSVVGVGTGSTTNHFIDQLADVKAFFTYTVSSSEQSTARLHALDIPVKDASEAQRIDFYVDGADEVDPNNALIKGGGGALTREKIVASAAEVFICIVDDSKQVENLGKFPLPVEVIPSATKIVAQRLSELGGRPELRAGFTDNENRILDVHELTISEPEVLERRINNVPGVVTVGIFAIQRPQIVIIASPQGTEIRS